jgi:hypothetical protein
MDLTPKTPSTGSDGKAKEVEDPRRSGVAGGDVIRDCAVVE